MQMDLLKQAQIFADLDEQELEAVAEICTEISFKFGQKVFKEGERGNRLYILQEGEVRISREVPGSGEEALTVLKPGACFGALASRVRYQRPFIWASERSSRSALWPRGATRRWPLV